MSRTSGEIFSCGSVRGAREPRFISRRRGSPALREHNLVLLVHTHTCADNTLYNSLSPPSPPAPPRSPAIPFFLTHRLDVLFRFSCSPRLAPRSRSVFLRCSKPRAGPAITRSRLTVAPCMAACFMLPASHCDAHRASERSLAHCCISVEMRTRYPPHRSLGRFQCTGHRYDVARCNTVVESVASRFLHRSSHI